MATVRGVIELVKTNVDTGQSETYVQENTTVGGLFERLSFNTVGGVGYNNTIVISDSTTEFTKVTRNPLAYSAFYTFAIDGTAPQGEYWPQYTDDSANKQHIFALKKRFSAPTSASRTINSIMLRSAYTDTYYAALNLNTPCIQTTSDILDVYYRLYVSYDTTAVANDPNYNAFVAGKLATLWKFFDNQSSPIYVPGTSQGVSNVAGFNVVEAVYPNNINMAKIPYSDSDAVRNGWNYSQLMNNVTYRTNYCQGSVEVTYNIDINSAVGSLIRHAGTAISTALYNLWDRANIALSKTPILPAGTSKVQSVYLRSPGAATSNLAYLDASNIGSSQATMQLDDSAYTGDVDIPLMFRVNITTGGTTADARYTFETRPAFGFANNQYNTEYPIALKSSYKTTQFDVTHEFHYRTQIEYSNDWNSFSSAVVFDEKNMLSMSDTGISKINVYTEEFRSWDANTTPALNTTSIVDMAPAPDGSIYVATIDAGLHKISADGNTITKFPTIGSGIDATKCYAFDIKSNGDVWAVFEGGLAKLNSSAGTWQVFNSTSTPAFSHSLLDNNWTNTRGISVAKTGTDDKLAIFTTTSNAAVWWSPTVLTTATAVTQILHETNVSPIRYRAKTRHYVTKFADADKWISVGYDRYYLLTFGSTTATQVSTTYSGISSSNNAAGINVRAMRFDNGGDYVMAVNITNGYRDVQIFDSTGAVVSDTGGRVALDNDYNGLWRTPSVLGIMNQYGTCTAVQHRNDSNSYPVGVYNFISPNRTESWKKYGWNGTSWVVGSTTPKAINTTYAPMFDGITIKFTSVSGTATDFIVNEFWNGYFYDGLHKDNSTTAKFGYIRNTRNSYITSDVSTNTIPSALGTVTDAPFNYNTLDGNYIYNYKGMVGGTGTYLKMNTTIPTTSPKSELLFAGNFTLKFKATPQSSWSSRSDEYGNGRIGFYPANADPSWAYGIGVSFGKFYAYANNAQVTTPAVFDKTDEFSIVRTDTTLSYRRNGVEFYSQTGVSGTIRGTAGFSNEDTLSFRDMKISYTESRPVVYIGKSTNQTGVYDPKFAMVEAWNTTPRTLNVQINGVAANVVTDSALTLVSGDVLLLSKAGMLVFSAADIGKTITVSAMVLQEI